MKLVLATVLATLIAGPTFASPSFAMSVAKNHKRIQVVRTHKPPVASQAQGTGHDRGERGDSGRASAGGARVAARAAEAAPLAAARAAVTRLLMMPLAGVAAAPMIRAAEGAALVEAAAEGAEALAAAANNGPAAWRTPELPVPGLAPGQGLDRPLESSPAPGPVHRSSSQWRQESGQLVCYPTRQLVSYRDTSSGLRPPAPCAIKG